MQIYFHLIPAYVQVPERCEILLKFEVQAEGDKNTQTSHCYFYFKIGILSV